MSNRKPPIELKAIQDALAAGYPLVWVRIWHNWYRLSAITYTWENGSMRTRKLWSSIDMLACRELNAELVKRGANIDPDGLGREIRRD